MAKVFRRIIMPMGIGLALCISVFYLLGASGPVHSRFATDLSFLIAPLIGFIVLLLAGKLTGIFLPSFVGKALSRIFTGAAFIFIFYMLFSEDQRLSEIKALASYQQYISKLSDTRVYAALVIVGGTIYRIGSLFKQESRLQKAQHVTAAAGLLLTGFAIWSILRAFIQFASALNGVSIIVLAGFIVAAMASLAGYGQKSRNYFIADACSWAVKSQLRIFTLGVLFGSYIVFIRPEIVKHLPYAPLIEWALVCLVVSRIYRGVRSRLQDQYSTPLRLSSWEKHEQELERKLDNGFVHLSKIQEEFVESGVSSGLLDYLVLLLYKNKWSQGQICESLDPLISHRDEKLPWFAFFGCQQKRVQKRNRKAREDVLHTIMGAVIQQPQQPGETLEVKA